MKRLFANIFFTASVMATSVPACAVTLLTNPDATSIYLLQSKWAKQTPPYAQMVPFVGSVISANEFQKPSAATRAEAALKARAADLIDINEIMVRLVNRFSEYDAASGEFDLDLNDGSYIPFSAFGRQIHLALTNGSQAQAWKLPPQAAETALRNNRGNRSVTLVLTLALLDSPFPIEGEPLILNAKIERYEVVGNSGNIRLGSMTVAAAP